MASYYVWSGAAGANNGTSWANAYTNLVAMFTGGKLAGDVFYVAHDHVETSASAVQYNAPGTSALPCKVVCVDRGGSVPPVPADRRNTAQLNTTGTAAISINGNNSIWDGFIFNCGTGAAVANINVGTNNGVWLRLDNCSLRLNTTATSFVNFGTTGATSLAELNNTTMSFGAVGQSINLLGILKWRNTPSALLGTIPTALFLNLNTRGASLECTGVDLSAAGSGKTLVSLVTGPMGQTYRFIDCKLNASATRVAFTNPYHGMAEIDFVRSSATGNYSVYRYRVPGTLEQETTIVRTGGASDGTTPLSWKVLTTANCNPVLPFDCPPIVIWNDTTGSPKTATVEGIWGAGVVPTDDECFLEVQYLGDAGSPLASQINDGRDLLTAAANQASSSEVWSGSTTKFKLACTFTALQKGWIYARVKCAKASSTFYIDPLVTLT